MSQHTPMNKQQLMQRNNVVIVGEGPRTLVMAHGLGCDQRIWHKIVPLLAADYRLVLFDYTGFGESDSKAYEAAKYSQLSGFVDDLQQIVKVLELQQPALIAHSASGSIAALLEQAQPGTFSELIMLGPSPRYLNDTNYEGGFEASDIDELLVLMEENYFQWAELMAATTLDGEKRPELSERLVRSFQQEKPERMLRFAKAILHSDTREAYQQLDCPVHVLSAAQDSIVPQTVIAYLKRHVKHCTHHPIDDIGHYPQLSAPAQVVQITRHILG